MSQVIRSQSSTTFALSARRGRRQAAKFSPKAASTAFLLEAGPNLNPEKDFKMLMWPYEAPHRGAGVGGHARENFGEFLAPNGAWQIEGEPYTSAGRKFQWFRSRIVGGALILGRNALRCSIDFKRKARDGLGDDCRSKPLEICARR